MKVALRTNFAATGRALARTILVGTATAAEKTADAWARDGQKQLRRALVSTGLGRMQGAVRYQSSLKRRGRANSRNIAAGNAPVTTSLVRAMNANGGLAWGTVFNVGGERSLATFDAYSARGVTQIRPKGGKRWLAFPAPNSKLPKRVGRNKITPALWNSSGLARTIGPLVFIKGPSANVAFLAVQNVSVRAKTGGAARALGKRGGVGQGRVKRELIVAFILIRGTTRTRRFNPNAEMTTVTRFAQAKFAEFMRGEAASARIPVQPFASVSGKASGVSVPVRRA